MKKINIKNLIKFIILIIAAVILISDFLTILTGIILGNSVSLTYFGIFVDIIAMFTAQSIIEDFTEI